MLKQEFLARLRKGLSALPQDDLEECLIFYSEIIEDRMEEGLSEEEAVSAAGAVDEIVAQATAEKTPAKTAKKNSKTRRRPGAGEILLLALGSPIWLSLGIAAFAVILSLCISLWAVIISLWAVFASFAACAIAGAAACVIFAVTGYGASGVAMLAAGFVCAGLAIFLFYGCRAATTGNLILTKKMAVWIKNCIVRKGEA